MADPAELIEQIRGSVARASAIAEQVQTLLSALAALSPAPTVPEGWTKERLEPLYEQAVQGALRVDENMNGAASKETVARAAADFLCTAMLAASPQPPVVEGWRDIASAPKDGTEFQAWLEGVGWEPRCRINPDTERFEAWGRIDYDQEGWDVYSHLTATHWMPVPAAPETPR